MGLRSSKHKLAVKSPEELEVDRLQREYDETQAAVDATLNQKLMSSADLDKLLADSDGVVPPIRPGQDQDEEEVEILPEELEELEAELAELEGLEAVELDESSSVAVQEASPAGPAKAENDA